MQNVKEASTNLESLMSNYLYQEIEDDLIDQYKIKKNLYLDTVIIINIVRGIWLYDNISYFNKDSFYSDKTLVNALIFDKRLENISLLPPHQVELSILLEERFLFPKRMPSTKVDEFLNEFVNMNSNLTEKSLDDYFQSINREAKTLYKINYIFETIDWNQRLGYLFDKVLNLEDLPNEKINNIKKGNVFTLLKSKLFTLRPKKIRSNLIDALALAIIHYKLSIFKSKFKKKNNIDIGLELPVFYTNSSILLRAISEIEKSSDNDVSFSYKYNNKKGKEIEIPIIRNEQFLILDSIFSKANRNEALDKFAGEISQLKTHIKIKLEEAAILSSIIGDRESDRIQKEIDSHIDIDFFKEILFDNFVKEKVISSILDYIDFQQTHKNSINNWTLNQRKEITSQLKDKIKDYSKVQENWIISEKDKIDKVQLEIDKEFINIKKELKEGVNNYKLSDEVDVIYGYGLVRFTLGENIYSDIKKIANRLSKDFNDDNNDHFNQIANNLSHSLVYQVYKNDKSEFITALIILWIFQKYDLIEQLCDRFEINNYPTYHLALIHAESILRHSNKFEKVDSIIECLENKFEKNNYNILIGMSRLYFSLWERLNGNPSFPELKEVSYLKKYYNLSDYYYINKSLEYIDKSIRFLEKVKNIDPDKLKRRTDCYFYAINNLIYFTTQAGTIDKFDKLENRVRELARNNEGKIENSRFNDTLSCYYLRKACLSKNKKQFNTYLKRSEEYNKKAIKQSLRSKNNYTITKLIIEDVSLNGFNKTYKNVQSKLEAAQQ